MIILIKYRLKVLLSKLMRQLNFTLWHKCYCLFKVYKKHHTHINLFFCLILFFDYDHKQYKYFNNLYLCHILNMCCLFNMFELLMLQFNIYKQLYFKIAILLGYNFQYRYNLGLDLQNHLLHILYNYLEKINKFYIMVNILVYRKINYLF